MNRVLFIAALVAAVLVPASVWLDSHRRETRRRERAEFELLVERELDRMVSLDAIAGTGQDLMPVLRHLARQTRLPLYEDREALAAEILRRDSAVDVPAGKMALRNIFLLLRQQRGIEYFVRQGKVVITQGVNVESRLSTRVYPLPQVGGPEQAFGSDGDTWIEVLTTVIEPNSWDDVGGKGNVSSVPGAVIVTQTDRVHERLRQFFRQLAEMSPTLDARADYLAAFTPRERQIVRTLDAPCDFSCTALPLTDAVEVIAKKLRLPILLLTKKVEEAGISPTLPLSLHMNGTSFRSVLRSLLRQAGLTYVVKDDAVQVTTPEDAGAQMRCVAYNVRDLVSVKKKGRTIEDYDSLMELISSTIQSDQWDDVGGPGSMQALPGGWIVFRQTDEIHAQTAELLTCIRLARQPGRAGMVVAPTQTPAERNLSAALVAKIRLKCQGNAVEKFADELSRRTGVNVQLDVRRLGEEFIRSDTPVTCDLPELPLHEALSRLLQESWRGSAKLDWIIRDESLVITTQQAADYEPLLQVLDLCGMPKEKAEMVVPKRLLEQLRDFGYKQSWIPQAHIYAMERYGSLLVVSGPRNMLADVRKAVELVIDSDPSHEAEP